MAVVLLAAPAVPRASESLTVLVGRPTGTSAVVSVLSPVALDVYVEYGTTTGRYAGKSAVLKSLPGVPLELELHGLTRNTRYFYRVETRANAGDAFHAEPEYTLQTQRSTGTTFTFALQGDSHPERAGKMYSAQLYRRTMERVAGERPDFYFTLGDDFSIERLIARNDLSPATVNRVYAAQRDFLGIVGRSSPVFLVNGNHEEAARFLLDGSANSAAALAGRARTTFFPLPAPDAFYSGDMDTVAHVGLLRDYYAFTWGDALFVTIDPYWHSSVQVDADPGGKNGGGGGGGGKGNGKGNGGRGANAQAASGLLRDEWNITLGDAQYAWLAKTLEESHAKYKFVFAHHVMGTGRGAVEVADGYEWGGHDRRGNDVFRSKRPTWPLPIHQLMVKTGVTVFFQGHDHLFARQEKDGVVYQETPNPADDTYSTFNADAYRSGDILPNAGHLRVRVTPDSARVEYVRSFLAKDETARQHDGDVAFAYTVKPRAPR